MKSHTLPKDLEKVLEFVKEPNLQLESHTGFTKNDTQPSTWKQFWGEIEGQRIGEQANPDYWVQYRSDVAQDAKRWKNVSVCWNIADEWRHVHVNGVGYTIPTIPSGTSRYLTSFFLCNKVLVPSVYSTALFSWAWLLHQPLKPLADLWFQLCNLPFSLTVLPPKGDCLRFPRIFFHISEREGRNLNGTSALVIPSGITKI